MTALDIPTVQAFVLIAELQSFTRAAEALGSTQAAISMKLQRLEALLGKRLVERSPRAVKMTADGLAFRGLARELLAAHDRALSGQTPVRQTLTLGISDHAAGPELVPLLERFRAISSSLILSVSIGFSRDLMDQLDAGELDAVIARQEGSRRGGEQLSADEFGWFVSAGFVWQHDQSLPLALLAAPCGIRAVAIRALDKSKVDWNETFVGGGVAAVVAAAQAGLAVAPLAKRIAPLGLVDIGPANGLPRLPVSKVMLHSRVSDTAKLAALRTLAAAFKKAAR